MKYLQHRGFLTGPGFPASHHSKGNKILEIFVVLSQDTYPVISESPPV